MIDLPLPLPDWRTTNKNKVSNNDDNYYYKNINNNNKKLIKSINNNETLKNSTITSDINSSRNSDLKESTISNGKSTSLIKLKQIEDMRQKLLSYKLLTEKAIFLNNNNNNNISNSNQENYVEKCNIILFGPSGSGKSSFIKSLYRSLYNSAIMPPEVMNKLIIKGKYYNEGTINFTKLYLVPSNITNKTSGITLCDTRGHTRMDDSEWEQFKVLLEGNVKDGVNITQRKKRTPELLWEFWKKDSELFPKEIFDSKEIGINSVPHAVVFIFDGSSDEVIQSEDAKFYKDLVDFSKNKGYKEIHVIMTRIDIFEKNMNQRFKNMNKIERMSKINLMKDEKIEKVIDILGVNRANIHFIENYHDDENDNENEEDINKNNKNNLEIDYHILKTLSDIINSSELFISYYMSQKLTCLAGCFFNLN